MRLAKGRLVVEYSIDEKINTELDKDLTDVLEKYGFRFFGGGYSLVDRIRDLSYRLEGK